MSVFNYFIEKLKNGIITFINMVTLANRDYPYHDYHTDTMTAVYQAYAVGENNIGLGGTQNKMFVSKSCAIYATTEADIKLNSVNNVEIDILATTWYTFETNIRSIYYKYSSVEGTIYIIPEGVLPNEARMAL